MALQTIVSRENDPLEPAVVTVGSIHGGTKHNIIPDEVKLQLTVRSYTETRKKLLAAIARIAKAEAAAAGAPEAADVVVDRQATPGRYNDPALTKRLVRPSREASARNRVVESSPVMGGEDFGDFGTAAHPVRHLLGRRLEPGKYAAAGGDMTRLPSLHSSEWAPDREPTLKTGATALTVAALELLGRP